MIVACWDRFVAGCGLGLSILGQLCMETLASEDFKSHLGHFAPKCTELHFTVYLIYKHLVTELERLQETARRSTKVRNELPPKLPPDFPSSAPPLLFPDRVMESPGLDRGFSVQTDFVRTGSYQIDAGLLTGLCARLLSSYRFSKIGCLSSK